MTRRSTAVLTSQKLVRANLTENPLGLNPLSTHPNPAPSSMSKLGKKPKFIGGLRITDQETMDIVKMVLVGKINTDIVSNVCLHGGKGIGISGKDNHLIKARKRAPQVVVDDKTGEEKTVDLGLVGEIENVNPEIIEMLTANDYIPIVSPIGVDDKANTLNLNADTVAGDIAAEVDAEKLIILTDVPGILEDPNDPETLIKRVGVDEILELIDNGIVTDGMIPKVETCINSIQNGVKSAHIIDGRIKHSVLLEIFTKRGTGTMITR